MQQTYFRCLKENIWFSFNTDTTQTATFNTWAHRSISFDTHSSGIDFQNTPKNHDFRAYLEKKLHLTNFSKRKRLFTHRPHCFTNCRHHIQSWCWNNESHGNKVNELIMNMSTHTQASTHTHTDTHIHAHTHTHSHAKIHRLTQIQEHIQRGAESLVGLTGSSSWAMQHQCRWRSCQANPSHQGHPRTLARCPMVQRYLPHM